jgi:hypothetical protein
VSADDAERPPARDARRRELARMPKSALLDIMASHARERGARHLVGGPRLWPKGELIDGILGFEFDPVPPRGRGRPPIGPATQVRLTPAMREGLDAAARPGEGLAEAARRLLAVVLDPVVPEALALAAVHWDGAATAACLDCADHGGAPCEAHAGARGRADACRALLADLTNTTGSDAR